MKFKYQLKDKTKNVLGYIFFVMIVSLLVVGFYFFGSCLNNWDKNRCTIVKVLSPSVFTSREGYIGYLDKNILTKDYENTRYRSSDRTTYCRIFFEKDSFNALNVVNVNWVIGE